MNAGKRNRIEIVAKPHRRNAIERDLDVIGREIAQARRHQPHEAIENDFEHRKTLIRHHRRIDDGANAGVLIDVDFAVAEAKQVVDLFLRQNTFATGLAAAQRTASVIDHRGPLLGHGLGKFIGFRFSGRLGWVFSVERAFPLGSQRILIDVITRSHKSSFRFVTE